MESQRSAGLRAIWLNTEVQPPQHDGRAESLGTESGLSVKGAPRTLSEEKKDRWRCSATRLELPVGTRGVHLEPSRLRSEYRLAGVMEVRLERRTTRGSKDEDRYSFRRQPKFWSFESLFR